ncbi:hypothetical protein M218_05650 [Burkholderia pseudomallei MSHR338]|nr:hypothetical protein M218_05650 [Burkholderia pseudomallei MSHR338]
MTGDFGSISGRPGVHVKTPAARVAPRAS